ncbi:MAG: 4Fe-4S binding protein [Candidatus Lokiarchaeota archaeon]|nr:4Fe-4S binding protein [Candidatus Lokiarchaeota archaeon]
MNDENNSIYRELQKHLDKLPIGFPATESGVELRILKHLFTSKQAELATNLSFQPLPLKKIYRKVKSSGLTIEQLEHELDKMEEEGLIHFGSTKEGDEIIKYYVNAPIVIGFYEFQLNRLTEDFYNDVMLYFEEAFLAEFNRTKIPQVRVIPVEESIDYEQKISTYDELRTMIENIGEPISVQECICRQAKDLIGDPCKKTDLRESCFAFRSFAKTYIKKGLGREISKEEALKILRKAEEDGLVLQPGNSLRPMSICTCCGCCCGILTNQKRLSEPAQFFATNFYTSVDEDLCVGCGICEDRCNMEAIHIEDDIAHVNKARCIGCGVCVPTCTSEAIQLYKKESEIVPPRNTAATYMKIMDKKAELARAEKNS